MTVDRELVTRKLLLITQDLDAVAPFATKPVSTFLESRVDQAVVERMLERMIGRMIDVNYHLITECGHPPPSDYHASFLKLAELGIVDHEFARRIARCAGLRNRVVHEYEEIIHARSSSRFRPPETTSSRTCAASSRTSTDYRDRERKIPGIRTMAGRSSGRRGRQAALASARLPFALRRPPHEPGDRVARPTCRRRPATVRRAPRGPRRQSGPSSSELLHELLRGAHDRRDGACRDAGGLNAPLDLRLALSRRFHVIR